MTVIDSADRLLAMLRRVVPEGEREARPARPQRATPRGYNPVQPPLASNGYPCLCGGRTHTVCSPGPEPYGRGRGHGAPQRRTCGVCGGSGIVYSDLRG